MVNGKQKGASWEREVCKNLSLWLSGGAQEDVLWRSSMSGGRSTVAYARGKRLAAQAGDISCIHSIGQKFVDKFMSECKFVRDLNLKGLLTGKGHLVEFWAEAKKQADRYGKLPMMIAKQNRLPATVCLNSQGALTLGLKRTDAVITAPRLDLRIYLLDDFLKKAEVL